MPSVTRGLYGEPITPKTVSLEHLKPFSWGGRTELANLALADKSVNSSRGSRPLKDVLTWEQVEHYCNQFNFRIKGVFDGYKYQELLKETCEKLGVVNPKNPDLTMVEKIPKKILRSMRNKAKKTRSFRYCCIVIELLLHLIVF